MVISGSAFHFLTHTGCNSSAYGGILPDPLTLSGNAVELGNTIFPAMNPVPGQTWAMIDGKMVDVTTSTSGAQRYLIVEPGDYPTNADERAARRAASKPKP